MSCIRGWLDLYISSGRVDHIPMQHHTGLHNPAIKNTLLCICRNITNTNSQTSSRSEEKLHLQQQVGLGVGAVVAPALGQLPARAACQLRIDAILVVPHRHFIKFCRPHCYGEYLLSRNKQLLHVVTHIMQKFDYLKLLHVRASLMQKEEICGAKFANDEVYKCRQLICRCMLASHASALSTVACTLTGQKIHQSPAGSSSTMQHLHASPQDPESSMCAK